MPAFRTICLFMLQDKYTHTLLNALTGYETQGGERSCQDKVPTPQQRLEGAHGEEPSQWTCPYLGGKEYPTLPMPHFSPGSHAKRVIGSLKDLIKIIQDDVQN